VNRLVRILDRWQRYLLIGTIACLSWWVLLGGGFFIFALIAKLIARD
jgi:hypothetical protein